MPISFDPAKNESNIAARGLSFELVAEFAWDTVRVVVDTRKDYGEVRLQLWGMIGTRLHVAVVTPRGEDLRVVSLRKANAREVKGYEKSQR
jgi:uncharacterized DUF497 family protein